MAPRPIARHQKLIMRLAAQFDAVRDGRFEVLPGYELVVDARGPATVRVPDLVLAPAGLPDATPRLSAGVPTYLLVEPGPPVVLTELAVSGDGYATVAEHRGRAALALGVDLDLDALG